MMGVVVCISEGSGAGLVYFNKICLDNVKTMSLYIPRDNQTA